MKSGPLTQRLGQFKEINQCHLKSLSAHFQKYMNGQASFETVRHYQTWTSLSDSWSVFLWNQRHKCSALVSTILVLHNFVAFSSPGCTHCEYSELSIDDRLEFILYEKEETPNSTCNWLGSLEHETHERCPQCFSAMMQPISFKTVPSVSVFEINTRVIKVSKTLKFEQKGETVWYHDGMTTGSNCENNGDYDKFSSNNLLNCKGNKLILLEYARV